MMGYGSQGKQGDNKVTEKTRAEAREAFSEADSPSSVKKMVGSPHAKYKG